MKYLQIASLGLAVAFWAVAAPAQTVSLEEEDAVETTTAPAETETEDTATEAATAAQTAETAATPAAAAPAAREKPAPRRVVRRAGPPSFMLRDLRVSGNSNYLAAANIAAFERELEGRRFLNASVDEIAAAFGQLYAEAGISTASARVQTFSPGRGVLTLQLVEPTLGKVQVGEGIISDRYYAYRLNRQPGMLADDREINARLQQLQLTDGIPLQVGFLPTGALDVVDLAIAPPPLERHTSFATLDNYGSAAQGEAQLTLGHTINSLTGWNDPLSAFLTFREGSVAGTLSYQRVVSRQGAVLGLSLSRSATESLSTTPVDGNLDTATLSLSVPIVIEQARRLTFNGALRHFRETADLAGARILDQRGTDVVLGLVGFQRAETWTLSGGLQYIIGRFSAEGGPDQRYDIVAANMSYSRTLTKDMFGSITVAGQRVTRGFAPASRQFTVTSPSGVRGYPTSLTSDDDGYYVRLQLEKSTPYQFAGNTFGLRPFVFFDLGENYDTAGKGLGLARSVGLGASFFHKQNLFGDIYIAKALNRDVVGFAADDNDLQLKSSITFRF